MTAQSFNVHAPVWACFMNLIYDMQEIPPMLHGFSLYCHNDLLNIKPAIPKCILITLPSFGWGLLLVWCWL